MTLGFTSCDSKLDIKPLGMTTLDNVDDLETLLFNLPIVGNDLNMSLLINDFYYGYADPLPTLLANNYSMDYALITYDESVKRDELVVEDGFYKEMYSKINYANILISLMPDATGGTPERKAQLIAEAKILRAWYHYLLVIKYAKQYDKATASDLGGIAYVDNTNVGEMKQKLTLAETYEKMLADCSDEVINDLIQKHVSNPCRFGADFGNAVRARILLQMKDYENSLIYAKKALAINSRLEDRSGVKDSGSWTVPYESEDNYYLMFANNDSNGGGEFWGVTITPDAYACYDPNDFVFKYAKDSKGLPVWDEPYYEWPAGCKDASLSGVLLNVWGLRSESMIYDAAECYIRTGNISEGLRQLDLIRAVRIENPEKLAEKASTMTEKEAMKILQRDKRIEFLVTFENFADRKRWNSESAYAEDIVRNLNATTNNPNANYGIFTLKPDSPLWVFPFPSNATQRNPSLTQNY